MTVGELAEVDKLYKYVMEASYKNVLRYKYVATLKQIGESLAKLRSDNVVKLSAAPQTTQGAATSDTPPRLLAAHFGRADEGDS